LQFTRDFFFQMGFESLTIKSISLPISLEFAHSAFQTIGLQVIQKQINLFSMFLIEFLNIFQWIMFTIYINELLIKCPYIWMLNNKQLITSNSWIKVKSSFRLRWYSNRQIFVCVFHLFILLCQTIDLCLFTFFGMFRIVRP
jgi:hypothetical protein